MRKKKPKFQPKLGTKPAIGSFILQNKLGPPVGKFKLSTGIDDPERFLDLQLCVKALFQRGNFQDLLNLKSKKITSLQLLEAYENDSIREDDWSTRSKDLFPAWKEWLEGASLAHTTKQGYGNYIGLIEDRMGDEFLVSQLPMLMMEYKEWCEREKAWYTFNNCHKAAKSFIRDTSTLGQQGYLYRQLRGIKPYGRKHTRRPIPNNPFEVNELDKLLADADLTDLMRHWIYFVLLAGMGYKEAFTDGYEVFDKTDPPYLLIKGQKTETRYRMVPLMMLPPDGPPPSEWTFKRAVKKVGGRQVRDLRRSYIKWLNSSGIDRVHIGAFSGHSVPGMTARYLQEDVKKWIRKDFPIFQKWIQREKSVIDTSSVSTPLTPAQNIAELGRTKRAVRIPEIKEALNQVLENWSSGDDPWMDKRYEVEHLVELNE